MCIRDRFQIIEKLKEKGVSIVYISHRMNEIFKVADEISVLRDGKMVITEKTKNLDMKMLIDYMIGKNVEKAMEWEERKTPVGDEVLLEVEHISLGDTLQDITFELRRGEILGLAGLMGSGRTEIVETLFGLHKPDGGEIRLKGEKVSFRNVRQAIEHGVVLVPEDRRLQGLILMHSVKDNMALPNLPGLTKNGVVNSRRVNQLSQEGIEELNVKTDGLNTKISNLSGGNQQKVVIAKWLKTDPQLLMMDEPTAGVDVGSKGEIINMVRNFAEQHKSVIFISSEIPEMLSVCDRIIVLRDGKVTGEFLHSEIESEEVLQHAIQN